MYICISCNRPLRQALFDSTFFPNLIVMLSAFIVLSIWIGILWYTGKAYEKKQYSALLESRIPLLCSSAIIGIGLGGFLDGIVLHQILQWHEMLSNKIPPVTVLQVKVNMFWDGIFHLFTFLVTLLGLTLFLHFLKKHHISFSFKGFYGSMLAGWSLFNLTEGVINHHILKLHNVREVSVHKELWNYGFLAASIFLLFISWILIKGSYAQKPKHL